MLGPIGPLVSGYLRKRGYLISRPTWIETNFTRSFWKDWFSKDPAMFATVYNCNRSALSAVSEWVSDATLAESFWRYGIPVEWSEKQQEIDRTGVDDVESEITAADLLGFMGRQLGDSVCYLEIGVSVGKNLLQVERQLKGAELVGIDVEKLNPILKNQFLKCDFLDEIGPTYEIETLSGVRAKKRSTLQRLVSDRNTFHYLSADQFRDDTWARLGGRRFNLIFSDGVHSAGALRSEFEFLLKYDLIDKTKCVMFWDDLHGIEVQSAFLYNARILAKMFDKSDEAISLFRLHGSYGLQRPMGMFSSL